MTDLPIRYIVEIEGEWFSNFSPTNKNKTVAEYCRYPRVKTVNLKRSADNVNSGRNIYFDTTLSLYNSDHYFDLTGKDYEGKTISIYRTDRQEEVNALSEMLLVFTGTISSIEITEDSLIVSCLDIRAKDELIEVPDGSVAWYLTKTNSFPYGQIDIDDKPASSVQTDAYRWTLARPFIDDPLGIGVEYGDPYDGLAYSVYLGAPWTAEYDVTLWKDSSGNHPLTGHVYPWIDPDLGGYGWVALNIDTGEMMIQAYNNGAFWPRRLTSINMQVGTDDSYNLNIIDAVILHLNKAIGLTYDVSNYDVDLWDYWRDYFKAQGMYNFTGFYEESYSCISIVENILASLNLTLFVDNNGLLSLHEFSAGYIKFIIKQTDVLNRPDIGYDRDAYLYAINITSNFGSTPWYDPGVPMDGKNLVDRDFAPWCYSLTENSYTFTLGTVEGYMTLKWNDKNSPVSVAKAYTNTTVIKELNKNTLDLTLPYVNQIDYRREEQGIGNDYFPEDYHWFRLQDRLDYFNWIPATTALKVKSIENFQLYDLVEYDIASVDGSSWLITGIDYDNNIIKLKKEKEELVLGYALVNGDLTVDNRNEGITFVDPALDREA